MGRKCIQLAEAKPWHWNKSMALNSDGILRGGKKKKKVKELLSSPSPETSWP